MYATYSAASAVFRPLKADSILVTDKLIGFYIISHI
jgi:hypothetical protein